MEVGGYPCDDFFARLQLLGAALYTCCSTDFLQRNRALFIEGPGKCEEDGCGVVCHNVVWTPSGGVTSKIFGCVFHV